MTSELFPLASVSVKSPRLRWMEKHNLKIGEQRLDKAWCIWHYVGDDWTAWWVDGGLKSETEIDRALIQLARNNNWKTWLEEGWENE